MTPTMRICEGKDRVSECHEVHIGRGLPINTGKDTEQRARGSGPTHLEHWRPVEPATSDDLLPADRGGLLIAKGGRRHGDSLSESKKTKESKLLRPPVGSIKAGHGSTQSSPPCDCPPALLRPNARRALSLLYRAHGRLGGSTLY